MSSITRGSESSVSGSHASRSAETEPVCVRQFRRWLSSGFTGCGFAQSFANNSRLLLGAVDRDVRAEEIDAMFDLAAVEHLPVVAIFSAIRTETELIDQLRLLDTGDRWGLSREVVEDLITEDVLIGVRWQTPTGLLSVPMGFGPFPTMPVTRRAPYVCLATWPGGHENPHRKKFAPDMLDFLDSALPEPLTSEQYRVVWNSSLKRTAELLSEPPDDSSFYRRVAFRLSGAVARRF